MTNNNSIYKCAICDQVAEIVRGKNLPLTCCSTRMIEQVAKTEDSSVEKHVPFVEEVDGGVLIKIGETQEHPMIDTHFIEFIEIITKTDVLRVNLVPKNSPEAFFNVKKEDIVEVREYCNLHGLWKN